MNEVRYFLGLWILLFSLQASAQGPAFERIVVFGDDTTDSGNFARWSDHEDDGDLNKSSSYFNELFADGRATNHDTKRGNLLAIELLAKQLGHQLSPSYHLTPNNSHEGGTNFSVIGAHSVSTGSGHDLPEQVSTFLHSDTEPKANTLFVFSVGANDLRGVRNGWSDNHTAVSLSAREVETRLDKAAKSIQAQLTRLIRSGAKNFLVMNVADVGTMPETRLVAEYASLENGQEEGRRSLTVIASAGMRTRIFNRKLEQVLQKLASSPEGSHAKIKLFDLFDHLTDIKKDALLYGLVNVTDSCVNSANRSFTKKCTASTVNKYLYFDELHFSQATHQLLAGGLYDSLISWDQSQ